MNERELFQAALDYTDAAERQAFLVHACGADVALRTRVETLLASHAAASQFLNQPAVAGDATIMLPPKPETGAADDSDDELDTTPDLSFLQPASKPGSIGTLGHYEILQVLGQGAFGIVFKAFDEKLHRIVAIKAMNPQLAATSPPRKRFLREARSVAAVKHDNIVQIHSVEEQPLPYLVMEFVDGLTLQQKLVGDGPLETLEILHLGRQMASGLAAAHEKGLIHRDIKPGNILLEAGAEQKLKITDFGLARAADDATMTRTGMIAGTPMYMAPEQAMGQALDHRADLFSLGSVLYQMACGRAPFRGPNAIAVLKRVVDEDPRAIQEILPEVPDWLCGIIAQLHAKNPDERFQTAKDVADLLARCQSELQLTGQVTSLAPRAGSVRALSQPVESSSIKLTPKQPEGSRPLAKKPLLLAILLGVLVLLPITCTKPISRAVNRWLWPAISTLPVAATQSGLSFDGKDDFVEFAPVDWSFPQFTIEAFVTSSSQSDNGNIVSLTSGGKPWELMELYDGHQASPGSRNSGAQIMGKTAYATAYGPLTPGVRQHRVLVFDGSYMHSRARLSR